MELNSLTSELIPIGTEVLAKEQNDKKPMILIVDDDDVNREILRGILEESYRLVEAADGQEALDRLREHEEEIDGVILDLIMPKLDGYGFLQEYAKNEKWKDIPVLISSGDERSGTESRCLEMGAWDVLRKPFNPAVVYLRLNNNISRRRLHLLEKQQKQRIINIFQRYEDAAVLDELLTRDVDELGLMGKTVEVAVLFADIRDFTSLAEQLTPETTVDILTDYLTLASRAVSKYQGTLDKFIGDCAMAFWGAPLECEDKEYRACLAARDIIRAAAEMNESVRQRIGRDVTFGIGIHVGQAVVGNIGSKDRLDYTAIGDTVNTASRLQDMAPPGCIYISRAVANCLGDRAKTTLLGQAIQLKGKKETIEVLTLDSIVEEGGEQSI